jgi:predicted heme/steroid binding protein
MESKKINQLATEMSPASTDLTIIGDPITGVSKKITLEQISSLFSSSISFYTNYAAFPATGNVDTLYCAKDTYKLYIWNGSAYVETFPSQALLDTYQLRSEKGANNGYASLDGTGKVPSTQLPSYVDDVIEVANYASLPVTGETGKIYITLDNNKIYRWSGSVYVEIAANNAIWGSITGTLSNQTDLQNALDAKVPTSRTLSINGTSYDLSANRSWSVGTVTSVAVTESSAALSITGSPITTSGTINIGFAGASTDYVAGDGSLVPFPTVVTQAQNLVTQVYNETGATLTKGTVVYINGGHGNLPTITKALATSDATSAQTYGVVRTDITNNNNGYVTVLGNLDNIDTQAYAAGTQLYLSSTTAGAWTSTKQYAPAHLVYVGIVTRSHPTQGVVEIRIQNGFEMDELHNVSAQSPSNNDGIFYNTSTSLWEKKSIATALGFTPISLSSLSATTPLSYNSGTGAFSIQQSSGSQSGYLSSTDWTTFNNKQSALTNPVTGTGTSGQVSYFNGTSTITGSNNFKFDGTNLTVGNPSSALAQWHVYNASGAATMLLQNNSTTDYSEIAVRNDSSTATSYFRQYSTAASGSDFGISRAGLALFFSNYATNFAIGTRNGGNLIFGTADTERARIDTSGNFGIGTTSPSYKLDVNGQIRVSGAYGTSFGMYLSGSTYGTYAANRGASTASAGMGYFSVGTQKWFAGIYENSDNYGFYSVGYAGFPLTLNYSTGAATFSSSVTQPYSIFTGATPSYPTSGQGIIDGNGGNLRLFSYSDILFYTNGSQKATITSAGNVGIGTSSPNDYSIGSSAKVLQVTGSSYGILNANAGSVYAWLIADTGAAATGTSSNHDFKFTTNNTERMRIFSNGSVSIGSTSAIGKFLVQGNTSNTSDYTMILKNSSGTDLLVVRNDGYTFSPYTYNATTGGGANMHVASDGSLNRSVSSIKYKKNVKSYTKGLAEVLQMKPVTYNSINENETNTYAGLIAEDIHELGLTEFVQYADDKTPDALAYSNMVALLVKAIQELSNELNELKAKIK